MNQRWCVGLPKLGIPGHYTDQDKFYTIRRKHPSGRVTARLDSYCSECNKFRVKKWRQANPDKVSVYNHRWWWSDVERNREACRTRARIARGKFAWVWKRYRFDESEQRVNAAPFRQWLKEYVGPLCATRLEMAEAAARNNDSHLPLITYTSVSECIEFDLSKIVRGGQKTVPLLVVEKTGALFDQMDLTYQLYPPTSDAGHGRAA